MRKILPVIKREYLTRVRTKGFIIGTIAGPVIFGLMFALPILVMLVKSERPKHLVVVDLSGKLYESLIQELNQKTKSGERLYQLSQKNVTVGDLPYVKEELSKAVDSKEIDGYIIIPADVLEKNRAEFYAKSVSNFRQNEEIKAAISAAVTKFRLQQSGLDPDLIHRLVHKVDLKTFKVAPGGKEEEDVGFTFGLTYVLVMVLYMMVLIYGGLVMRSVIEEKNSRVVEIIVSSVRPFQLMAGKILGTGAVGLTQVLIWALFLGLIFLYKGNIMEGFGAKAQVSLPSIPISVIIYFVVFFLLGYVLFSTMYAGLGAMVNSEQEAAQLQMPLIFFLIIPMMIMMHIISHPDSSLSVALSLIPFFTPIIMFMRICVQMPSLPQILASIALLILTIIGMIWVVARIYRVGILMYGKRPNLPELIKWIRYG